MIEVACLELERDLPTGASFHRLIHPQRDIPDDATRVHGITLDKLRDAPRFEEIADETPGPGQVRVDVAAGGICGSDLHYYFHGGFGTVRIKQPMVLGHEVSGVIAEVGSAVSSILNLGANATLVMKIGDIDEVLRGWSALGRAASHRAYNLQYVKSPPR